MNKIDSIRRIRELSYAAIAKKTGLTSAYIQQLAKGKRNNPSLDSMQKIASALDERVESVFKINQERVKQPDEHAS